MKWNRINEPKKALFVQATQPVCRYLLAARDPSGPHVTACGSFELDDRLPLAQQIKERILEQGIQTQHVVLLLPRAMVEVASHNLPPATKEELPELVSHAVALAADDASGPRTIDFLVTSQDHAGIDTLVFSSEEARVRKLEASFKSAGFQLSSVTLSGMGSVELLRHASYRLGKTTIVIGIGDHDVDLAVEINGHPIVFRSLPIADEQPEVVSQGINTEIQRMMALYHIANDESTRLYLLGNESEHRQLSEQIGNELVTAVVNVNPFEEVQSTVDTDHPSRYANLVGMACAWNQSEIRLDLLNPRKPAPKTGPLRRAVMIAGAAAIFVMATIYMGGRERAEQDRAIELQKTKLKNLQRRADKAQTLRDIADAVDDWRRNDIAWLDEIRELSARLPSPDQALIRRMSMSTNTSGNGVIDLGVQVSEPEVVARLEDAVRDARHSISSKRVSETGGQQKLPWAFETRIVFKPSELPELTVVEETGAADEAAEAAENPQPDGCKAKAGGD